MRNLSLRVTLALANSNHTLYGDGSRTEVGNEASAACLQGFDVFQCAAFLLCEMWKGFVQSEMADVEEGKKVSNEI
jgi:hypothetical protein